MYLNAIERTGGDFAGEESYLQDIPAVAGLSLWELHRPVTFLVGENGSGKSTLLEAAALALGFNPEGGSRNFAFSTRDTHSGLHNYLRLHRGPYRPKDGFFLRAESFYNTATEVERLAESGLSSPSNFLQSYGGKSLHHQSHGESFLSFFQTFDRAGLYLMAEPEAALSPQRQLALLSQMTELAQAGAQFVVASHSPILLGTPGARILSFDEGAIHEVAYEDTESYQVTELFINHRDRLLHELVG